MKPETRKLTAAILWEFRKNSRKLPPLIIPESVKKAARAQGWKFRS
jgi:hypothetical protein